MEIIIGIIVAGVVVALGWGATAQSRRRRITRERRGEIGYSGAYAAGDGGGSSRRDRDNDNDSTDSGGDSGGGGDGGGGGGD